jgi:hypothetical protein
LEQVAQLEAMRGAAPNPVGAERALDALLASGFVAEEDGELRPTDLAVLAAESGRGDRP